MESLSEFATMIQHYDHFMSIDIVQGYRHLRLHPAMLDWFIFKYEGRYYQCVALPFGWGLSPLWFTRLMIPFVTELRRLGYRVLGYLDDFLICPSPYGIVARKRPLYSRTEADRSSPPTAWAKTASHQRGVGSTRIEHLGVVIDSESMKYFVAPRKVTKVKKLASRLLREVRIGHRWVSRKGVANVLWCLRVANFGNALGKILHSLSLLGPLTHCINGRTRPVSPESSRRQGPDGLEATIHEGIERQAYDTLSCGGIDAHRRSRHGVRWNNKHRRYETRSRWTSTIAGHMELERPGAVHHPSRASSNSQAISRKARRKTQGLKQVRASVACGQPGGRTHYKQFCVGQPAYDARIATVEVHTGPAGDLYSGRMDPFRRQQICGCSVATLPPRRLTDPEAAAAFRAGWYGSSPRRIQVPATRRAPRISSATGIQGAGSTVAQGRSAAVVSTRRSNRSDSSEANPNRSPSSTFDPELAPSAIASSRVTDCLESDRATGASGSDLGRTANNESIMASTRAGHQPRITRSAVRMLSSAGAARIRGLTNGSASGDMSADLVADYAWSDRTTASRNSQWRAWMKFCEADGRYPLPVTEAHMVSFVGWLALKRQAGRRSVSGTSLPQYFSALRQMQIALTGIPVPQYPFLAHIVRGYERWEGENYPQPEVRMGIDATIIQRIWALGITTSSPSGLLALLLLVRDAAVCVFAFCFNGLRDSSVLSIETSNVEITEHEMTVRLSMWKGKRADRLPLVRYHRLPVSSSPLDLWARWHSARAEHSRYFALPGEPIEWTPQGLSRALQNVLRALSISPPRHGKYTSHSLRIGSHTEQILIGIPMEIRLARFGWGPDSQSMAAFYFDRTIRISAASFWVFGRPPGGEPTVSTPQESGASH